MAEGPSVSSEQDSPDIPDVGTLRRLFRNLQAWEELYLQIGLDTVSFRDKSYHLGDIQYLYRCRTLLTPRQRQAIELCLYEDMREVDVSQVMGVSPTNPVAMYATNGLRKLVSLSESGEIYRLMPRKTGRRDRGNSSLRSTRSA